MLDTQIVEWWSDGVLEYWVTGYTLRVFAFWILDCGFGIETSFAIRIPKSEMCGF
jgi:hypothetical protein